MKGIGDLMKQAQEMQSKLAEAQEKMAAIEVKGESGAGMVQVTMNCRYEVKRVEIDPSLLSENKEILEDLTKRVNDHEDRITTLEASHDELRANNDKDH